MEPFTLALLAWGATLLKGKQTADRLEYFPKNIEIIRGKLVYSMEILNPTVNPLKVDSFFGGIYADDKKIGSIEQGTPFTLAKKTRTVVKFPVKMGAIGLAQFISQVLAGKFKSTKFKVAGIARALGVDKPVTQDISLNA